MNKINILLLIVFLCGVAVNGAKILCVFNAMSYSHYILGHRLLEELAYKGHEVTMVAGYKNEKEIKNYRHVLLDGMKEALDDQLKTMDKENGFLDMVDLPKHKLLFITNELGLLGTRKTLENQNFQKLLKENAKYDLIILEQFFNDALKGLCHHFQAPCIAMSTVGSNTPLSNYLVANPTNPSYIPEILLTYSSKMCFFQRLHNSIFLSITYLINAFIYHPKQNALMLEYFPKAPHLTDIVSNTSIVFLNSHPSANQPVPHTPNMIEIGGFHIRQAKNLPDDLQKFLDGAKDGAILFSLGSNIKSKDLPFETMQGILKALEKVKLKVLLKMEIGDVPGLPGNVKIANWLPQQDVLAHPNIKLFVTHGGLLSTIEAVYYGVPMIGIPFAADQSINMQENKKNGIALMINFHELDEKSLSNAFDSILGDKRYFQNAKQRSEYIRDQPMKPLDAAVYWSEFVIRHKGAPHLKSAAVDLYLHQYLLLDVLAFIVFSAFLSLATFVTVIKKLCRSKKATTLKKKMR